MATVIRRNLWPTCLIFIMAGSLVAAFVLPELWQQSDAQAEVVTEAVGQSETPAPEPLPLETYERIQQLRQELALTNRDLAMMNTSEAQTQAVLEDLQVWLKDNEQTLVNAEVDEALARRDLRRLLQQMHMGTVDRLAASQVPVMRARIENSQQQVAQVKQQLADAATRSLRNDQRTLRHTAMTNTKLGVPDRFRYTANLTAQDARQLRQASRTVMKINNQGQVTRTGPGNTSGSLATSNFGTASFARSGQSATTLTNAQLKQNLSRISEVEAKQLPLPVELKAQREIADTESFDDLP